MMKKKILIFALCILSLTAAVGGLVSCAPVDDGSSDSFGSSASSGSDSSEGGTQEDYTEGLRFTEYQGAYYVDGIESPAREVVIPSRYQGKSVIAISRGAFESDEKIETLVLPASVQSIGEYAFWQCSSLKTIRFSEGLEEIGALAFAETGIESLDLPDSVHTVQSRAFEGCVSLKTVILPEEPINVSQGLFADCPLEYNEYEEGLYLGSASVSYHTLMGVKDGAEGAFELHPDARAAASGSLENGQGITSLHLPSHFSRFDCFNGNASSADSQLEAITVDAANETYSSQDGLLYNADKTRIIHVPRAIKGSVVVADGVTSIGSAFSYRRSITSVVLPDTVESIEDAFQGCESLESVNIPLAVRTVYVGSFNGCVSLKEYIVPENHAVFASYDGVLYGKDPLVIIWAPPAAEGKLTIPDGVTVIPEDAFSECSEITEVYIPDSVRVIEQDAFMGCSSLSDIRVPSNLLYMGYNAFPYRNELNYNEYENGLYLGNEDHPFEILAGIKDKTAKTYTIHPDTRLIADIVFAINDNFEEIVIPDSVFYIGNSAFYGCMNLKRIVLPASLKIIEANGLYANLEKIYYKGTAQQWEELDKNNIFEDAVAYIYSASQPSGEGNYWHYDADGNLQEW